MKKVKLLFLAGLAIMFISVSGYGQCYVTEPDKGIIGSDATISQIEAGSLQWMREEEMLAHDVYSALSVKYSTPIFRNISKSEMVHTTAVAGLLEKYEIEDPAADHQPGVFTNPEIQTLFDKLIEQGSSSYQDAIRVGLQIEDIDIFDLEKAFNEENINKEIKLVYSNLLRGSGIHMNAFWRHASRNSIDWEPEYISKKKFAEIVGLATP